MTAAHGLRAPNADGGIIAEPPLGDVGELLDENRRSLDAASVSIMGRSLGELRRSARCEIIAAARAYLQANGEPAPTFDGDSLLLAGHQPELFHPGVWIKNFALYGLSRKHAATPINLIVDNDTAKNTAIHIPSPSSPATRMLVPYDRWSGDLPYEELRVQDEELFASFPDRVMETARTWGFDPLLPTFWAQVRRHDTRPLGERLVAGRRAIERAWGCHNLELPIGKLCGSESFAWFAGHLLSDLPRFHAIHNEAVRAYRKAHGLRSRSHPVPDLISNGDWLETPFWAWHPDHPRRGRLMARVSSTSIDLRLGTDVFTSIPLSTQRSALSTFHDALSTSSVKIRPRALTNTLFARLFVGDIFMHGIGGAKYDEVTDTIITRFYGIQPPRFLALSGTLLLPFTRSPAWSDECAGIARELRDLHWNPQRHLPDRADARTRELARSKDAWITSPAADGREQWQTLRKLTDAIRPAVAERVTHLRQASDNCRQRSAVDAMLSRRDYAFCLFPEAKIRPFCTQFLSI